MATDGTTRPDTLVTGATGFIGGHLTRTLVQRGHRVRVLARAGSDRSAFADLEVAVEEGGLDDTAALERATAGVRHIYHCAGMSADWGPWSQFARTNVDGVVNLVAAAAKAETVERLLHVSTTDVYGYPEELCDETAAVRDVGLPYNRSKINGERALFAEAERARLPWTVVRPATVYGPRDMVFGVEFAQLLQKRKMVLIGGGMRTAGLLYVSNAVDAMITACHSSATVEKVYNLRDPEPTTWREYVDALATGLGLAAPTLSIPVPLAMAAGRVCEFAFTVLRKQSRPLLTRHAVLLLGIDQSYPIDRARRDFGFGSGVSAAEGIARTVEWLQSPDGRRCVGH
ncbi:NAD(P)-dependent oxidoreductase [Frankia sp. CiP3]|uniref:NAD-dependent epimerase/dehydratase family protein n=1 Tax=Frankia sp. CiP3 TaxID=2880971 RepID=UPI001EF56694|nr:NAD-dependent epimerase/dehydratase family protein [Frankia sp. CiP3]